MKTCSSKNCKQINPQPLDNFATDTWRKDGKQRECKSCRKSRYQNNKRYNKGIRLKFDFGITIDEYEKMLENQDGKCNICNIHYKDYKQALSVDHCHKTGKIRSLLCNDCNLALGLIKENSETLVKMISYIEKFNK